MPERTCCVCGADIGHRRHDAIYCGRRCSKWAGKNGLTGEGQGQRVGACERCGAEFRTRNRTKRFCSERCRQRAEHLRRAPQRAAYQRQQDARRTVQATCEHCAACFSYVKKGRPQKYCSHSCYTAAKRAPGHELRQRQKAARTAERARREHHAQQVALLRSDPCAYCGGPGGVVDHIVPRALDGQDDWTNMTGACAQCNSYKGTQPLLHSLLYLGLSHQIAALTVERAQVAA
jgi:5-methylcytosine-specific restriction endonuclease McrA